MDGLTTPPNRTNFRSSSPYPPSISFCMLILDGGLLDAEKLTEQGMPIGRYPGITLRNAHFQYIVTWSPLGEEMG